MVSREHRDVPREALVLGLNDGAGARVAVEIRSCEEAAVRIQRGRCVALLLLVSFFMLCFPVGCVFAVTRNGYDYGEPWNILPHRSGTDIAMQILAPIAIIYLVAVYPGQRAKAKAAHEKAQQEQREIAGVAKTLEDPDPAVADAGVQMLAKYGQKAVPAAESLLAKKDPKVRSRAVAVLATIGGASAIPSLGKALADSDPAIRLAAIDAITAKPDPASAKVLTDALANPDSIVRAKAAAGLGALRDKRAVKPLERLLTTETDEAVKKAARDTLGAINSPAPPKPAPASPVSHGEA